VKVILEAEKKVLAAGKILCTVSNGAEAAMPLYERGYNLVIAFSDGATLASAALSNVDFFRKAYPNG